MVSLAVLDRTLGKGEAESSILSSSTTFPTSPAQPAQHLRPDHGLRLVRKRAVAAASSRASAEARSATAHYPTFNPIWDSSGRTDQEKGGWLRARLTPCEQRIADDTMTMDNAAFSQDAARDVASGADVGGAKVDGAEQRAAPRFTLLIRAAKLVSPNGEFVCVVRDVSETGISVRLFHKLPSGSPLELHMPGGGVYVVEPKWERGNEVGFQFSESVDVQRLIGEAGEYPKRGLRLGLFLPIRVSTLTQRCEGMVLNLSQQGARFECDGLFAIDQTLRIETSEPVPEFSEVRAKVRWRRDREYGVVFDDTFTLGDFARLGARLQCPGLLDE